MRKEEDNRHVVRENDGKSYVVATAAEVAVEEQEGVFSSNPSCEGCTLGQTVRGWNRAGCIHCVYVGIREVLEALVAASDKRTNNPLPSKPTIPRHTTVLLSTLHTRMQFLFRLPLPLLPHLQFHENTYIHMTPTRKHPKRMIIV